MLAQGTCVPVLNLLNIVFVIAICVANVVPAVYYYRIRNVHYQPESESK